MKNTIVIILILVAGGVGFLTGVKYQQSKQPPRPDFQAMRGMKGASGLQRPAGSEAVRGEIIDKDEESITVKLPDDSSKIVLVSENTTVNKATEGSMEDLETGKQVMIFGQTNSDGSVSATNIQLDFRPREL